MEENQCCSPTMKSLPSLLLVIGLGTLGLVCQPSEAQAQDGGKPRAGERGDGRPGKGKKGGGPKIAKPKISDTVRANVYADNWFKLYINGNLAAVDSISFIPHNVVSVDILPEYPMTIAVMAKDNADKDTGLEYDNTNLGDGGFILKFGDGTMTDTTWKARSFFHGPINGDGQNPKTRHTPIPADWFEVDFDDSGWDDAIEHSVEAVGPKEPFYEHDFAGAKWIWTEDLALDNTVLFRTVIARPPNGAPLPREWPRGKIDESNRPQAGKANAAVEKAEGKDHARQ